MLTPGSDFSHYQITGPLGAGGMGEVYRATDTKLKREVALKVLPPDFATDADRLARFQREAELLAALNHPNVGQIYGLETQGTTTALVMELVEGPTLAERIAEGPLAVEEALRIAKQLIEGLEAAHDKGIVHRDLKPANIKVKADGQVKILDFGIAKAAEVKNTAGAHHSPTMVTPAVTESGVIMGTAAYMSPEQARGKFVDQRTDVWAFGCVLYEMLTGQPAFGGEDVMVTLAKVLANNTDLDSIPAMISPAVRRALQLSLEKDPAKRIHHIGDVKLAMEGKFDSLLPGTLQAPASSRVKVWMTTGAVALLLAGVASAVVYYRMLPEPQPVNRFVHHVAAETPFRNTGRNVFALAPNGRFFAYNTQQGIYLRNMGELEARLVAGTQEPLVNPFFSPDSAYIGYRALSGPIKRIAISGGAPVVVTQLSGNFNGASWNRDGNIYWGTEGGIFRVSANGGTPELLVQVDGSSAQTPELLPDGDTLLYTLGPPPGRIMAHSLGNGDSKELFSGARDARYLKGGYLVYGLSPGDGLFALRFDLDTLTVSGSPVPLVQGVRNSDSTASVNYGIAEDGTLAYVVNPNPGTDAAAGNSSLVLVDREGNEQAIDLPLRNYDYTRVSPDGERLVVTIDGDLWVADIDRPVLSRITATERVEFAPIWTPDSQDIVFTVNAERTIFRVSADGTGAVERLAQIDTGSAAGLVSPGDWVGDGNVLTFTFGQGSADPKIGLLALNRANNDVPVWEPLIDREAGASGSVMAPGSEWIAYHADDTGQYGVYIERFPALGNRRLVSDAAGGWGAFWSADGSELFYRRLGDGAMMAVSILTTPTLQIGTPQVLFQNSSYFPATTPIEGGASAKSWALAPDGRFLMIKLGSAVGVAPGEDIVVVQHWTDELQRLVPAE
jgi:eukaryotic-like serine/threonine-protein kinase